MATRTGSVIPPPPEGFSFDIPEPPEGFSFGNDLPPPPPGFSFSKQEDAPDPLDTRSTLGTVSSDEPESPSLLERGEALFKDFTSGTLRLFNSIPVLTEEFADATSGRQVFRPSAKTAKSMGLQGEDFTKFTEPRVVNGPSELGKVLGQKKADELTGAVSKSSKDLQKKFQGTIDKIKESLPKSIQERRDRPIVERDAEGNLTGVDVNVDQLAGVIAESLAFGGGILALGRAAGGSATAFGAANATLVSLDTLEETKNETREKLIAQDVEPELADALATEAAHRAVQIVAPISFVTGRFGEGSAAMAPSAQVGLARGAAAGALSELPEEVAQAVAPELARDEPINPDKVITAAVLAPLAGGVHGGVVGGVQGRANRIDEKRDANMQAAQASGARVTQAEKNLLEANENLAMYEATLQAMAQEDVPVSRYEQDNPDIGNALDGLRPRHSEIKNLARDEAGTLLSETANDGRVEAIRSNTAKEDIKHIVRRIEQLQQSVEQDLIDRGVAGAEILDLKFRKEQRELQLIQEEKFLGPIAATMQEWVNTYNPGMKVYVTAGALGELDGRYGLGSTTLGHMVSLGEHKYVVQINPKGLKRGRSGEPVSEREMAEEELATIFGAPKDNTFFQRNQELSDVQVDVLETAAHEFGHALAADAVARLDSGTQDALFKAWRKELLNLAKDPKAMSLREATRTFQMPRGRTRAFGAKSSIQAHFAGGGAAALDHASYRDFVAAVDNKNLKYLLSFDEWMANQFAKFAGSDPVARGPVETFFARVGQVLRRFHERFKGRWAPNQTYEAWVKGMAEQVRRGRFQQELAMIENEQDMDALMDSSIAQAHKLLNSRDLGLSSIAKRSFEQDLDKYGSLVKWGYTLTQLAKLNPHIPNLQAYVAAVKQWWVDKSRWGDRADTRLKEWRSLGKDQGQRLARFLLDVTQESTRVGRRLRPEELQRLNQRSHNQLTDGTLDVFNAIDSDFQAALGALEQVLVESAGRAFTGNPQGLTREIESIRADINKLRGRNYFPLSRFGKFTVSVFAEEQQSVGDRVYNPGDTILFETYDTRKQQLARKSQLERQFPRQSVGTAVVDETTQTFAGMPQALVDRMLAMDDLQLTDDQKAVLRQMSHEMSPAQSYKKHLLKRTGTLGFSLDSMRGYASYFMHFSNHIARVQNQQSMRDAIDGLTEDVSVIQRQGGDATKRAQMRNHLTKHNQYIMNPGNELANLRALGFLWYLGANIKSAFVNLTQVPLVTYPYLAARKEINPGPAGKSDAVALQQISKAIKDVTLSVREGRGLESEEIDMVDTLKERGIIDESLAMDLAALAEGSTLQRVLPGAFGKTAKAQQMIRDTSYYAAWLFQAAEKFNRRATAVAAYRMARKVGMPHENAIEEAHLAVETTQFEYARWNRARFMQGKKGVIFLFWQYLQNALHFATHDPGAIRYLILMAVAAGLTGLPFMEDILDILDAASTKIRTISGMKNPKVESRLVLRKFIEDLGANPDLILNGVASEYGLGPLHVFELAGIPVPNVDITGSLSLGEIVPGLNLVTDSVSDSGRSLVEGTKDVVGAALSIPIVMYQAYHDPNPDNWKKVEKAMPTAIANISKAVRRNVRGAETSARGARLVDVDGELIQYDPGDPQALMESIAQGMGFAPTRIGKARVAQHTAREMAAFYEMRRRQLMAQFDYALQLEDKEGIADVKQAIRTYNETVPNPALKLDAKGMLRSLQQRRRARVLEEKNLPRQKRNIGTFRDVQEAYDTDPAN